MNFLLSLFVLLAIVCFVGIFFARQIDLPKSWFKLGGGAFSFLALVVALNPFYIVEGGHRGIVTKLGAIQNIELEEGLNIENQRLAIDKWNGSVPTYMMGNSTPFIQMTTGK